MTAVIDIRDLHKHFGHVRALDGLDLAVEQGAIHGFLGPHGAGKPTTIRVLLGTLRALSGHVSLLSRDPSADAVDLHREIAYVPGDVTLRPSLTGGEIIDLLARMRGGIDNTRYVRKPPQQRDSRDNNANRCLQRLVWRRSRCVHASGPTIPSLVRNNLMHIRGNDRGVASC
jgi:ABC-type multidrug transport system ATPase subunit